MRYFVTPAADELHMPITQQGVGFQLKAEVKVEPLTLTFKVTVVVSASAHDRSHRIIHERRHEIILVFINMTAWVTWV